MQILLLLRCGCHTDSSSSEWRAIHCSSGTQVPKKYSFNSSNTQQLRLTATVIRGPVICRFVFSRVASDASAAVFKEHWSQIEPAAVIATEACLQQLQACGLLEAPEHRCTAAPHACAMHASVLTVTVDDVPELVLAGEYPRGPQLGSTPRDASGAPPSLFICVVQRTSIACLCPQYKPRL